MRIDLPKPVNQNRLRLMQGCTETEKSPEMGGKAQSAAVGDTENHIPCTHMMQATAELSIWEKNNNILPFLGKNQHEPVVHSMGEEDSDSTIRGKGLPYRSHEKCSGAR